MPHLPGLGSRSLPAQLHRAATGLRAEVQRHSTELASGRAAAPARRVGGELGMLAGIEARLGRIAARDLAFAAQSRRASAVQDGLAQAARLHEGLRAATLAAGSDKASPEALERLGRQGQQALSDIAAVLARAQAGQAVFSGDRPDTPPLAPPAAILAAATAAVAGAASAQEAAQRIHDMFHDSAGAFQTSLYMGGNPVAPAAALGQGMAAAIPTAAAPALRAALQGAVLAALAGDPAALPGLELRRGLAILAVEQQAAAGGALAELQADLGTTEAALAEGRTRLSAERDALETARNGHLGVDPYEAAVRLEEARRRLETLYVVTARVARLSLTEYLR